MQKKKSFRNVDHPAAAFISGNDPAYEGYTVDSGRNNPVVRESNGEYNTQDIRRGSKAVRRKNETKSKRLNLLIRPSLMDDFIKVAYMRRTSINDLINTLIDECVKKDVRLIDDYDRLFEEQSQR
jgi:hypothetical protein